MIDALFPSLRDQMEVLSALLAFCAGNSPVVGEFPPQTASYSDFDGSLMLSC